MHKDRLKLSVSARNDNPEELLNELVKQMNGVHQWRVEPIKSGASDYEVIAWKGNGLSHVRLNKKFEDLLESEETIKSGSVDEYWKNI